MGFASLVREEGLSGGSGCGDLYISWGVFPLGLYGGLAVCFSVDTRSQIPGIAVGDGHQDEERLNIDPMRESTDGAQ
jgi:hypothetical protein